MIDVNDLGAIQIRLASPEEIRKWSHGEVKKPETINYRTLKPERDGLFCEKIFGPTRDWECFCGKYKRVRDKGVVCDRCGVEITRSAVRRERLGHIELAAPVSHIWYFKSIPSKMALILGILPKNLEKVLYFASGRKREDCYKVVDPGSTDLEVGATIRDIEYKIYSKYDPNFKAEPAYRVVEVHNLPFSIGDRLNNKEYTRYHSKYKGSFTVEEVGDDQFEVVDIRVFPYQREDELSESEVKELQDTFGGLFEETPLSETVEEPCYIVIEPGQTGLKVAQIILETEARLLSHYDSTFKAGVGAEAIKEILSNIDVNQLARELRKELREASGQKAKKLIKRLQVVESFAKSGNRPEWMILEAIPVLPPDLRPMVQLDGGRFATSDLNDLYRRVINRNNRLKRLLQLGAPEIIVKNEKRMLQEAVDALFDNGRRGRPVLGPGNRPLKSLSDMLKGKKGRFRQNLLGKRVDYSGRSVIVSGPRLSFSQCGIPKKMALELFKPFVMKKLVDRGFAQNIKSAKRMVEKARDEEVWAALEEVITEHPVLLNRAPTLHRLSIQAFQPVLVEGNAIQLHPLACSAFNADFDGDQMAVHVPLSAEAQAESQVIMLSSHNVLSPASGKPVAVPTQDMVLGCYYLTLSGNGGSGRYFGDIDEALLAYQLGNLDLHESVKIREVSKKHPEIKETTLGRAIFNGLLPDDMPYYNEPVTKKKLTEIVDLCYRKLGNEATVSILDKIKRTGFNFATRSGTTISIQDLEIPPEKWDIIEEANQRVEEINQHYAEGLITEEEREQKVVDIWTDASNKVADAILKNLDEFNPVNMMAKSGARGSIRQVSQLSGMRGLMADPSGRIIEYPIKANFREGLSVLEYFISTHGARKGLADTALRTSKSGYLTRRLVDVAQDMIIREEDCGTEEGVLLSDLQDENQHLIEAFEERVLGRVALKDIVDQDTGEVLVHAGEEINEEVVSLLKERGVKEALVRSPLTCRTRYGVCQKCYGRNLATGRLVDIGEAVGVVAAQSIGEPGTQLTLRTFHTGGIRVTGEDITQGLPRVEQLFEARKPKKAASLSDVDGVVEKIETVGTRRKIYVLPDEEEEDQSVRTYFVPQDVRICVTEGEKVKAGDRLTLGPIDPRDILRIKGIKAVQEYLLNEIQSVYVSQGVSINDKHIEVIIRQIANLNKVMVENAGDTTLLSGELVFLEDFNEENQKIGEENKLLTEKAQEFLTDAVLMREVVDITGEVVLPQERVLDEGDIRLILSSDCKPFLVEKEGNLLKVVRGYRNLEIELANKINVEEVKTAEDKVLLKAGELLKPEMLDQIADMGPIKLRVRDKAIWEKLRGSILAEEVVNPQSGEMLLPANARLDNETIELLDEHGVEKVVVWKDVKVFPIKENLVKALREEILGKEVAKDIISPQNGEVIVQAGQAISRGIARRLVSEGVKEIPLSDGRFFSIEGRLVELLEKEIVGKVVAQDIVSGSDGVVMVKAGEVIGRDDVIKIAGDNIGFLLIREPDEDKEIKSLVEEILYLPGLKQVATGKPVVLGITKASLAVDSFLSAASFQQTTHVLADAAIKGKVDELIGLKENVIIGKAIPAGTGFSKYRHIRLSTEETEKKRKEELKEESLDVWELMGTGETFGNEEEIEEYDLEQDYFDDTGES